MYIYLIPSKSDNLQKVNCYRIIMYARTVSVSKL